MIPKHPTSITGYPYDSRNDVGYGISKAKFHTPRIFNQYSEEPEEEEEELENYINDKTYNAVLSKLLKYSSGDPLAKKKSDPFYYAGAATKISETSTAKGMVPFPKMYNKKTSSGTGGTGTALPNSGPTSGFRTNSRPTGTKRGFSKSPYPSAEEDNSLSYTLEDILNSDVDEKHLNNLRKVVFLIHKEQEYKK